MHVFCFDGYFELKSKTYFVSNYLICLAVMMQPSFQSNKSMLLGCGGVPIPQAKNHIQQFYFHQEKAMNRPTGKSDAFIFLVLKFWNKIVPFSGQWRQNISQNHCLTTFELDHS
jgi:hypothetical protein